MASWATEPAPKVPHRNYKHRNHYQHQQNLVPILPQSVKTGHHVLHGTLHCFRRYLKLRKNGTPRKKETRSLPHNTPVSHQQKKQHAKNLHEIFTETAGVRSHHHSCQCRGLTCGLPATARTTLFVPGMCFASLRSSLLNAIRSNGRKPTRWKMSAIKVPLIRRSSALEPNRLGG